jgi:His-Xaa-Ser system protein HxsD
MSSVLEGLPTDLVSADLASGAVHLRVDLTIHPLSAVYAAAYVFLDRCFVLLDKTADQTLRVTLAPRKPGADEAALRALVGEFSNELLSAAWRQQIAQDNRAVIEMVTSQAIAAAMGAPSLDDLAGFDFGDESFEDPLGIAMSWEEKYKKKPATAESGAGSLGEESSGAGSAGGEAGGEP